MRSSNLYNNSINHIFIPNIKEKNQSFLTGFVELMAGFEPHLTFPREEILAA